MVRLNSTLNLVEFKLKATKGDVQKDQGIIRIRLTLIRF